MVTVRGDGGKLVANFGVSLSQIGQVQEWSFTPDKGSIDITQIGLDGFGRVMGGTVRGSFTANVFYDPTATGNTQAILKQAFLPFDDATAIVNLYLTATKYIAFSGLITSAAVTGVSPGAAIMVNVQGASNGAIDVTNL